MQAYFCNAVRQFEALAAILKRLLLARLTLFISFLWNLKAIL